MKNILMVTCLVFWLAGCSGGFDPAELKRFPAYEEVFEKAFGSRNVYIDNKWYLKLARKPDGWYIVKRDMESDSEELYLFWSYNEKNYLPFPSELERTVTEFPAQPHPGDITMFRIIPFYGYRNWHDDVISHLEGKQLNDTLTEALARAYDAKASVESGLSYGIDGKTVKAFTAEQQTAYMTYMDKALETYRALHRMNPAYNTIVGSAFNKYSNECMYAYSSLKYFGDGEQAGKYLRNDLYSPVIRSFAKNILGTCEKNAILITYGDNDYYPLIYAQEKLGYRKDVALLNMSLMTVGNYIGKFTQAFGLRHTIDTETYNGKTLDVVLVSGRTDTVNMGEVLKDFSAGRFDRYNRNPANEVRYPEIPGNCLYFAKTSEEQDGGFYLLMPKSYIYKNDLFLWDLLFSNPARAISLTSVGSWAPYLPYTKETGLLYTFTRMPASPTAKAPQLDTARTEALLLGQYTYGWTGKNPDVAEKTQANGYLYQFYRLASAYKEASKQEKAVAVVMKAMEVFPQKTLPASFTYCALANVLRESGEEETAMAIYLQYLSDAETALKKAQGQEKTDLLQNVESISVMLSMTPAGWDPVRKKAGDLLMKYKPGFQSSPNF